MPEKGLFRRWLNELDTCQRELDALGPVDEESDGESNNAETHEASAGIGPSNSKLRARQ
jgi:hypothetical protein